MRRIMFTAYLLLGIFLLMSPIQARDRRKAQRKGKARSKATLSPSGKVAQGMVATGFSLLTIIYLLSGNELDGGSESVLDFDPTHLASGFKLPQNEIAEIKRYMKGENTKEALYQLLKEKKVEVHQKSFYISKNSTLKKPTAEQEGKALNLLKQETNNFQDLKDGAIVVISEAMGDPSTHTFEVCTYSIGGHVGIFIWANKVCYVVHATPSHIRLDTLEGFLLHYAAIHDGKYVVNAMNPDLTKSGMQKYLENLPANLIKDLIHETPYNYKFACNFGKKEGTACCSELIGTYLPPKLEKKLFENVDQLMSKAEKSKEVSQKFKKDQERKLGNEAKKSYYVTPAALTRNDLFVPCYATVKNKQTIEEIDIRWGYSEVPSV